MKICFVCFLIAVPVFNLIAQSTTHQLSRDSVQIFYNQAKKDFSNFEKEHGHFIQTANVRMHYLTWGNPRSIPLIWCHGSLSNGYEFLNIADSFVKEGFYVIAIDYYGHGQTAIPNHEVSLYHVADDIKSLMDKLSLNKAILGGWSRGGSIATAFYDAYPKNVLGLILEDGGSVSTNTYYKSMNPITLANKVKQIGDDIPADTSYNSEFDVFYTIYDNNRMGSQFESLAWINKNDEGKWAICPGALKLFNMRNSQQFSDNILRPTTVPLFAESMAILEPKIIYRNLNVPLLILDPTSKNDLFPFEKENEVLRQQHPGYIDHLIYEATDHNIHNQRPQQFIKDVLTFLKKVKRFYGFS